MIKEVLGCEYILKLSFLVDLRKYPDIYLEMFFEYMPKCFSDFFLLTIFCFGYIMLLVGDYQVRR